MRVRLCFVLLIFGPFLAGSIRAGDIQTPYQRGMLLEKQKNYQAALAEFQAVPKGKADYVKASKEIGTCHYYLGERDQAVTAYDLYLELNPADTDMRSFVDGLRKSLPAPAVTPVPTPLAAVVKPFEITYGLRGSLGYGLGLSNGGFGYGRFDDYDTTACSGCFYFHRGVGEDLQNDKAYPATPGQGLAMGVEFLVGFTPYLELGLGAFPVGLDGHGSSDYVSNGNFHQTDSSSTHFQALPLLASLYGKVPLGPQDWSLVLGFGLGYAPAVNLTAHSDYTQDSGSGAVPFSRDLTKSLAGAVNYRSVLGVDYAYSRHLSFLLGLSFLSANFSANQDVIEESSSQGSFHYKGTTTIQYVDAPPRAGAVNDSGPMAVTNGSTETWDDGRTKRTQTSTFDPVTGQTTQRQEIDTKVQKGLSSNDLTVQQLAPFLAATWRF
jgi:hypothetical protein